MTLNQEPIMIGIVNNALQDHRDMVWRRKLPIDNIHERKEKCAFYLHT